MRENEHYLMTYDEVAKRLAVSKTTIERWVRKGTIPCVRSGRNVRFSSKAIDRWIERHSHEATG